MKTILAGLFAVLVLVSLLIVTIQAENKTPSSSATNHCAPLPPPTGPTVTVSSESELRNQATNAASGTTILVSAGTYNLQNIVHVVNSGLTIRGATGNRDNVILDAGGMGTGLTHGILIDVDADDVTIADLTIRNAGEHGVSIQGSDRPTLYNLHIVDTGSQLVKVNPWENGSEDGLLACSRLEYTTTAPDDYTNGISAHRAHRWVVRDNQWYRIRTPGNAPVPTILFWSESTDTVVERNLLVDCYQGIAFGNASHGSGDHSGGIVRNNFIYASLPHDSVIEMVHASGWLVAHNTALLLNPDGVTWGMEARFSDSEGTFAYNLTNMSIWHNRDGAQGAVVGNVTTAQSDWFVNAASGDLHLLSSATAAIDQAAPLAQVTDDYDGDVRPIGPAPDVGADEYGAPSPTATPTTTPTPTNPPCDLDGDLDGDGDVDIADIMLVAARWHTAVGDPDYNAAYDLDGSGVIDIVDIMLVAIHWGENCTTPTPTPTPTLTPTPTPTSTPSQLIQPTDLVYQGAFAYPPGDEWAYSGHALAYYPEGDPTGPADGYPGSLYAAAHAWYDLVGEITIPEPVIADNFDDLPQASVLRALTDITEGWKDNCTYHDDCIYREVDGLEYLPNINKIVWNLRDWYNVAGYDQDSLGWSELDMTGAQGVWHIGERGNNVFHNAKTCDYLFKAPESFASQYLEGKWLIAGNHRAAGAFGGSQGPTLYALAPWEDGTPPASGQNLDALALLYYPEIYPECLDDPDECTFPNYRPKDDWGGGAWVQTADQSGVLIFGRKGLGDNCYGTPEECGGDPCDPYKGYHAYPYEPQILFYDPEELKEVTAGTREPWEVMPYEVYSPVSEVLDQECATLGAAAYDQERGLIYVTEQEAGPWGETVVHVWEVGGDM